MPETKFALERPQDFCHEHRALYEKHVAEVGAFKDIKPDMLWAEYFMAADIGSVACFTARDASTGRLVGYNIYWIKQNPHYRHSKIAVADMVYLLPEYRGGTGEKFISWCDTMLKGCGVQVVTQHVKTYFEFGSMLKRLEYVHVENLYVRRLDKKG